MLTILSSVLLSGIAAFGVVKTTVPESEPVQSTTTYSIDGSAYRTVNLAQDNWPDFTYAAESAVDAVVFVKVTVKTTQQYFNPFDFFFGNPTEPQSRERVQMGSGSGVIIREDGYIVTNNHVVQNASEIEVTLNNNKSYPATVVGTDPATDVALIKIEADGLPIVPIGDSDKLRLGEWVIAIGSPLGEELRGTITAGIVSAKGRSMPNTTGEFKIESFIQTDAAVNPGNSGGALVNKAGELVGINTAIVSQTGAYSGYSFAVPSNIVKKIVGDLIDFGSVKRAKLGVTMSPVNEKIANEMKLSSLDGVYINEVSKSGAADKAGVKVGDVLIAIDSTVVKSPSALQEKVNSFHPGDKAVLKIVRDGKVKELPVVFQGTEIITGTVDEDGATAFYGGYLKDADKDRLAALNLKRGVEIVSAGNGTLAKAGATDGVIILYVNDEPVSKPRDVIDIAYRSKRAIYIEGVDPAGKSVYFGFAKE
ncbi:MAG: trypsin-like peptidase domain-containing protein [Bacteroidales bacterium]|nr:trypsin-like peptidase domain-containing protein [Bacteroidales bacterium]